MRTLVIDTATRACSVALFDDDKLIASQYAVIGRGHAEYLLPYLADFPGSGRAERIAVNVGPGSFTGIRVGISAAKALALAWDVDCIGYSCLSLVAAIAQDRLQQQASVDVIMTGGHGEYFFQSFGPDTIATNAPVSLSLDAIVGTTSAPVVAGDAGALFAERLQEVSFIDIFPDARCWPLIADTAALPVRAVYGRPPDAKPMAVAIP